MVGAKLLTIILSTDSYSFESPENNSRGGVCGSMLIRSIPFFYITWSSSDLLSLLRDSKIDIKKGKFKSFLPFLSGSGSLLFFSLRERRSCKGVVIL